MNFPSGVPCVSDANQSAWMEYVYMQKPLPTNITGVPVSISVIDSNGNYRNIGTTTTTSAGTYSLPWTPDVPGTYAVTATFAGTNSYYPSSSQTAFNIMQAAPTAPTATSQANLVNTTDLMMYLVLSVVAIIIAIAVATVLILRKRQ